MTINKNEYKNQTAELQIKILKCKKESRGTYQKPIKRENPLTARKGRQGYKLKQPKAKPLTKLQENNRPKLKRKSYFMIEM